MAAQRKTPEYDRPRVLGLTFPQWLQRVDRAIDKRIPGCSHHDLADACYWDSWDSGVSPAAMAVDVISAEFGDVL